MTASSNKSQPSRTTLADKIKAIRRVSAPIVAVSTPDPANTVAVICKLTNGAPKVCWNISQGMTCLNQEGKEALAAITGGGDPTIGNPAEMLKLALRLPDNTILFVNLANRFIDNPLFVQGLMNLRDEFKANGRTCILLGVSFTLPPELTNDVVQIDEPLPDADKLREVIAEVLDSAEMREDDDKLIASVEAVQGVSAFAAEQSVAMSLGKDGIDLDDLWESKRKQIEQCPALQVWRSGDTFSDIAGYDNVKSFLTKIVSGPGRPNAIVVIEEIEKALAGAGGDTSGVTQDQLGTLLTYMQDKAASGAIFVGPPGSGKSQTAKAVGNEAGVPTIYLDLGGAKGSLVGSSEQNIRHAMKVVSAISNDKVMFVSTCNSIGILPPELRRRFSLGTFYFDLPTADERRKIWTMYHAKFNLPLGEALKLPSDEGWTGAEIRNCCWLAHLMKCPLVEAAEYVVPVCKAAHEQIESLKCQADGRFISASYRGIYEKDRHHEPKKTTRRKVDVS